MRPRLALGLLCSAFMASWWKNNALSVTMALLFLFSFAGQIVAGHLTQNQELSEHGQAQIALGAYLRSAHFYEATFENWESEFLQMTVFVLLTTVLYQVGSSESKRPGVIELVDVDPRDVTLSPDAPWPVRRGGIWLRFYEHSLGLAFLLLFLLSFAGHALSGAAEQRADARTHGGKVVSVGQYLTEPRFWFESFQNWQSEFLSLVAMIGLSIYLRERGSPESKPVYAPHSETGR